RQVGERLQHREGTGLGLAISRRLVKLMGGELQLISPVNRKPRAGEGVGSCFFFTIEVPAHTVMDRSECKSQHRKITGYTVLKKSDLGQKKVLVVDDKISNRAVLRDLLEPLNFIVQEVDDGIGVLAACASFGPDIILMDLRMPKMDGFAAMTEMRHNSEFAYIPVIAVTASIAAGGESYQRCLKYGFDDYIHKPFLREDLLEMMASHLNIELSYSYSVVPEALEEITAPPVKMLNDLFYLVEIGEIQAITEKASMIMIMEAGRYRAFGCRVKELAEEFQFTALQDFIAEQQKG
ncbi:MAG: response regulator, partial [Candidatus Electrothrix sp. AR3]|nr:response regulator [Candidatus Electrothrix sp. AR3]